MANCKGWATWQRTYRSLPTWGRGSKGRSQDATQALAWGARGKQGFCNTMTLQWNQFFLCPGTGWNRSWKWQLARIYSPPKRTTSGGIFRSPACIRECPQASTQQFCLAGMSPGPAGVAANLNSPAYTHLIDASKPWWKNRRKVSF